jgi:hypothetical protein
MWRCTVRSPGLVAVKSPSLVTPVSHGRCFGHSDWGPIPVSVPISASLAVRTPIHGKTSMGLKTDAQGEPLEDGWFQSAT